MINLIVGSSVVLTLGFSLLWFFNKDLRHKIEAPKYDFLNKVSTFDDRARNEKDHTTYTNGIENNGARHED